jgi:DNA polymerase-3 subunit delta'
MSFGGVVGHAPQRELLARALGRGAVHPAYLFSGPPGVGKRRVALEVARAWLCHQGLGEPCGTCHPCRTVGTDAAEDWLLVAPEKEKEKRKTISVEQVREFTAWLWRTPAKGGHKAALVDPADALTGEAANALLKTLEEPPPGRVVVLVTSRPGGLPATVRSRCQQVAFGPLSEEEVAEVLRRNGWPAQAARQAAALADGSPGAALGRDAKAWQESAEAVRSLLEALGRGERGAVFAGAERLGEGRERALLALQALLGMLRQAARARLGAAGGELPAALRGLDDAALARLGSQALETHRRLEGMQPPNAKLALTMLLLGASGAAGAAAPGPGITGGHG